MIAFWQGDYATTAPVLERSLALAREADDQGQAAWSLGIQAVMTIETGDAARGVQFAADCRDAAFASGQLWCLCPALECLAYRAMLEGDFDRAFQLSEEGLDLGRRHGDKWGIGMHLFDLALFRLLKGDYSRSEALCAETIVLFHELADRLGVSYGFGCLAGSQAALGRHVRAARLWGAMHGLLDSMASPLQESIKALIGDRYLESVKESLGEHGFRAALSEGRAMSMTQIVQYALAGADKQPSR